MPEQNERADFARMAEILAQRQIVVPQHLPGSYFTDARVYVPGEVIEVDDINEAIPWADSPVSYGSIAEQLQQGGTNLMPIVTTGSDPATNHPTPNSVPQLPNVYFQLRRESDGVLLLAVDENRVAHPKGKICKLLDTGKIRLYRNINPAVGVALDSRGCIKLGN